jgi:hypothetical protein
MPQNSMLTRVAEPIVRISISPVPSRVRRRQPGRVFVSLFILITYTVHKHEFEHSIYYPGKLDYSFYFRRLISQPKVGHHSPQIVGFGSWLDSLNDIATHVCLIDRVLMLVADMTSKGIGCTALANLSPKNIWHAGDIPSPVRFDLFLLFGTRLTRRIRVMTD